jgi:hypothetical protein
MYAQLACDKNIYRICIYPEEKLFSVFMRICCLVYVSPWAFARTCMHAHITAEAVLHFAHRGPDFETPAACTPGHFVLQSSAEELSAAGSTWLKGLVRNESDVFGNLEAEMNKSWFESVLMPNSNAKSALISSFGCDRDRDSMHTCRRRALWLLHRSRLAEGAWLYVLEMAVQVRRPLNPCLTPAACCCRVVTRLCMRRFFIANDVGGTSEVYMYTHRLMHTHIT